MPNATQFLITFVVKPSRTSDFKAMLATLKTGLPKIDGCQAVRIFQQEDAAQNTYTLLETWDNSALHQAHVARLQAAGDWAVIEEMLSEPANGVYMQAV